MKIVLSMLFSFMLFLSGISTAYGAETTTTTQTIEADCQGVHIVANGEFEEGTQLTATTVGKSEQASAEKEIAEIRENESVVQSSTYDIKLLSPEGEEIQPDKPLELSFTFDSINENLKATVYHTDEAGTSEIPSTVDGNTVRTEAESFSYYTVEFTLGEKQFVLEGDGSVLLAEVLNELGLSGNVENVEVSDESLLWVDEDAGEYAVTAIKAFDTEEWMDVTIDGVKYRIILTDDQVDVDIGTTPKDIPGVVQGSGNTFADTIPVANIWIDEGKVSTTRASREAAIFIPGEVFNNNAGFYVDDSEQGPSGYNGKGSINFDLSKQALDGTKYDESAGATRSYNFFEGTVCTFKWENAALHKNAQGEDEYLDVYVEYSDLLITLDRTNYTAGTIGLFSANAIQLGNSSAIRYGISVSAKPYVMDSQGNVIEGTFYYPMVDIDVRRSALNSSLYDAENNKYYSEQVMIGEGIASDIYIPGGEGDNKYISNIDYEDGTYLFYPATNGYNDGNSFYSGFITRINNGDFGLRYYGSSGKGQTQMESYILAGTAFNHKLKHSSTAGGTIKTTEKGNHNGKLDDGSNVIDPTIIATATGQTVVYTFYPEPGYHLKEVWVNNQNIDYTEGRKINLSEYEAHDDDGDGIIDRYTYAFSGINSDNAIHVVWAAQGLTVEKHIQPTGEEVPDVFTFEIEAWNDHAVCDTCEGLGTHGGGTCSTCGGTGYHRHYLDFSSLNLTSAKGNPVTFMFKPDNGYEFELAGDDSVSINHFIPMGYEWEVEETGLGANAGWRPVGGTVRTGAFGENYPEAQTASFTNKRKTEISNDEKITIRKVWQSDRADLRPGHLAMHLNRTVSFLDTGPNLQSAMAGLSGNVNNITAFAKATKAQYQAASGKIDISVSGEPTYMWYSNGTIYYYSEADNIFMNENSSQMFSGMTNITDISGCAGLNTAFVENMFSMFRDCYDLTILSPLSEWDTGNVTSMRFMFASNVLPANRMTYSDISHLSGWDTKNVTDMGSMFRGSDITSVSSISEWNVSNVANMNGMFFRTKVTDGTTIAKWDTTRVGQNYVNAANGGTATGNFAQMFQNINNTTTNLSTLPVWTNRNGYWTANSANYIDNQTGFPVTGKAKATKKTYDPILTLSDTAVAVHTGNEWIYEIEVPNDGSIWNVYEDVPEGYSVSDGTTDGNGGNAQTAVPVKAGETVPLYNTHDPITITVTKVWDDESNADNTRPSASDFDVFVRTDDGLTLHSYDKTDTIASTETGNTWTYTFSIPADEMIIGLDEGLPGTMISHVPTGYRASIDLSTYTITNRLPKKDITITKKWEDGLTGNNANSREVPVVTLQGTQQFTVTYPASINTEDDAGFDFGFVRTGGKLTLKIDGQTEINNVTMSSQTYHFDKAGLSVGTHTFDTVYKLPSGEEYTKSGILTVGGSGSGTSPNQSTVTYSTSDDPSKWVKVSDDTWTYTMTVSDDNMAYKAWESSIPSGYITNYDENRKYTIPYGKDTVTVINEITKTLTVTKNVKGSLGDKTKEFEFTVVFDGLDPNMSYGEITADSNGYAEASFKLKDDQSWSMPGIPASCRVTVVESPSDHIASLKARRGGVQFLEKADHIKHQSLSTGEFQLLDDTTVDYTNKREIAPTTGVNTATIWLLVIVGTVLFAGYLWGRRRRANVEKLANNE